MNSAVDDDNRITHNHWNKKKEKFGKVKIGIKEQYIESRSYNNHCY